MPFTQVSFQRIIPAEIDSEHAQELDELRVELAYAEQEVEGQRSQAV